MPQNEPGYMVLMEAYPHDEELIALETMYYESDEDAAARAHKTRKFLMKKDNARLLAQGITKILGAPDTQAAWEDIAENLDEHCADLDEHSIE